MAYVLNPGQGSLFSNDGKGAGKPGAPILRGRLVTPSGEELVISAWKHVLSDGKPWLSISAEPAGAKDGGNDSAMHSMMQAAAEIQSRKEGGKTGRQEKKKVQDVDVDMPEIPDDSPHYGWDSLPVIHLSQ